MSDTVRNRDYLIAALADNNSGNITPQVMRDWLASIYLSADVDSAFLRLDGTVTAIPDATGAGDVVTTVNAILAAIRTHGLIASS